MEDRHGHIHHIYQEINIYITKTSTENQIITKNISLTLTTGNLHLKLQI